MASIVAVAGGARGVGGVDRKAIARRLRRIGDRRHDDDVQRRRIGQVHAGDPAHDRDAAQNGRGLLRVREHRQERRLVQDPEALRQHRMRAGPRRRDAVDRRQRAVDDAPVRAQQLVDRPGRVHHDLVDELLRLGVHRRARRRREPRVDRVVLRGVGDAIDPEPLAHDAHHAIAAGLQPQQAAHLRLARIRGGEPAARAHVDQGLVRRPAADHEREVGRQLVVAELDRRRGGPVAQRGDVEEADRLKHPARHQVDAVVVGARAVAPAW